MRREIGVAAMIEDLREGMEKKTSDIAGPDAVLGKPVDRDELLHLVEELCSNNGGRPA